MQKYLAGVLYYGPKDDEHEACMRKLDQHPRILAVADVKGCPYIDIGRASLAEYALAVPDAAGILFLDHDILFDMKSVDQILESCDESHAVVGAGYSMRSPGSKMIGGLDTSSGRPVVFFEGGGRYPAHYLGMGFTAIHRDALRQIIDYARERNARRDLIVRELRAILSNMGSDGGDRGEAILDELMPVLTRDELPILSNGVTNTPIRPFFALLQEAGAYYGEDVSFCILAKKAGVTVEMDTRVRVAHKGAYAYELEDCGFVVPILPRLEGLMTNGPSPQASPVSPPGAIRDAVEAAAGKTTEELLTRRPTPNGHAEISA